MYGEIEKKGCLNGLSEVKQKLYINHIFVTRNTLSCDPQLKL